MDEEQLLTETTGIVSAYLSNNTVTTEEIPAIIAAVHKKLRDIANGVKEVVPPTPAVDPKRSVFRDYIICLEDGKKFKHLKRHLSAEYGMTPDDYRTKWGLPRDYPMVAPAQSEKRKAIAIGMGFGRKPAAESGETPAVAANDAVVRPTRGRPRKTA